MTDKITPRSVVAPRTCLGYYPTDGNFVAVQVDADGVVQTSAGAGAIEADLYVWDGTSWVKAEATAGGVLKVNVDNWPADYPDSAAGTKLDQLLNELRVKLETADLHLDVSGNLGVFETSWPGDYPDGTAQTLLNYLLTELQEKLETDDLLIGADKHLHVDVRNWLADYPLPAAQVADLKDVDVGNFPADYPDSAVATALANLLTELQQKLETDDLNLDAAGQLKVHQDVPAYWANAVPGCYSASIATGTWAQALSHTVPAGKTLYLITSSVACHTADCMMGFEIRIGGVGMVQLWGNSNTPFILSASPILKVNAGVTLVINVRQDSGAAAWTYANWTYIEE